MKLICLPSSTDFYRLVLADWLEEHGDTVKATAIRSEKYHQVEFNYGSNLRFYGETLLPSRNNNGMGSGFVDSKGGQIRNFSYGTGSGGLAIFGIGIDFIHERGIANGGGFGDGNGCDSDFARLIFTPKTHE